MTKGRTPWMFQLPPAQTLIDADGNELGRMDTPELAALVVAAVNEHHKTIEAGKRVARQLADDVRSCPTCGGSGFVARDPTVTFALVKCAMCKGSSRVKTCSICEGDGTVWDPQATAERGRCPVCLGGLVPA